jgi:hypothetical protein
MSHMRSVINQVCIDYDNYIIQVPTTIYKIDLFFKICQQFCTRFFSLQMCNLSLEIVHIIEHPRVEEYILFFIRKYRAQYVYRIISITS